MEADQTSADPAKPLESADPPCSPEMNLIGEYLESDVKSLWQLHRWLEA